MNFGLEPLRTDPDNPGAKLYRIERDLVNFRETSLDMVMIFRQISRRLPFYSW